MTKYAEGTDVSTEKSMLEIQQTLKRYGADRFFFGEDGKKLQIAFSVNGRHVRLEVPLPPETDFTKDAAHRTRSTAHRKNAHAADIAERERLECAVVEAWKEWEALPEPKYYPEPSWKVQRAVRNLTAHLVRRADDGAAT